LAESFGEKIDAKSFVSQIAVEKIFLPGHFFGPIVFQPFLPLFAAFFAF